ncbi:large conductance mechanosensitive channel protein MscL [Kineococcus gynurae]|uniref:Large-conductance mechanosensitive channel n=1 Tax=Kineococcus gynurae TaxID=452979 RepID=A0ABV5LST1_9ACTN
MSLINGFKDFILRGNVIDLAVAVVIGTAFTALVKAIVDNLVTPILAAIGGAPQLGEAWQIPLRGDAAIGVGGIVDAILNFLIIAAVVYFVIVTPMNRVLAMRKQGKVDEPKAPAEDVLLLTEIRDLLAAQARTSTPTQGPAGTTPPRP